MPTRYAAGNTLGAHGRSNTNPQDVSTGGAFDSTYVSSAISVSTTTTGNYFYSQTFAATGTLWMHFDWNNGGGGSVSSEGPGIWNGTTGVFRINGVGANNNTFQCKYWNGSAWVNSGSTWALPGGVNQVDAKIVLGVGFELYLGGTSILVASDNAWAGAPPKTATQFRGYSTHNSANYFSQILVADFDTRTSKYFCRLATANGTYTDGTGTYTDINETPFDPATVINLPIVGNRKSFTKSAIAVPPGYAIMAACISAVANVASPATDGKALIRSGGSPYTSGGMGFGVTYEPRTYFALTDPATASSWTQAGFNSMEFGLEAA